LNDSEEKQQPSCPYLFRSSNLGMFLGFSFNDLSHNMCLTLLPGKKGVGDYSISFLPNESWS